jgi:methylmalonyl-CoA mutase N-terminal domain/subunit
MSKRRAGSSPRSSPATSSANWSASHMNRLRAIESGELKIIGVNCFQETAESPLTLGSDGAS